MEREKPGMLHGVAAEQLNVNDTKNTIHILTHLFGDAVFIL